MKAFAGACLSVLFLVASGVPDASGADDPAASAATDSIGIGAAPATTSPDSSGSITVLLRDGTERRYQKVEPWPGDFVRALRPDGKYDYLPKHDIAKITGEITEDVLGRGVAVGQTPEEKSQEGPGFFRSRPLPDKKSFPLLQAGVLARFDDPPNESESARNVWFDGGAMVNLSPKVALGGTIGLATDYDYTRITAKARLRRWLNERLAIDFAPGVFVPRKGTPFESGPDLKRHGAGFVGELALSASDWLALSYVIEVIEVDRTSYVPGTSVPLSTITETDVGHLFGMKTGGGFGLLGIGLILVGLYAAGN